MRFTVGAAIIEDKQLLLVKDRHGWSIPHGEPGKDEPDIDYICSRVDEILSGTQVGNIRLFDQIRGAGPLGGPNTVKVYLANINGQLQPPRKAINDYEWMQPGRSYEMSEVNDNIVQALRRAGYIR
jgi:hypothetical protein